MSLLMILPLISVACSNNQGTDEEQFLSAQVYVMLGSDEVVKPSVVLKDDNRFVFTYSALSSHIGMGTYEKADDKLILKEDDGRHMYVFIIEDNTLIFSAEESSQLPSFANVPDGSVFTQIAGPKEEQLE